uniref:hypothetical protein n=1 Tax=Burkholderia arboris TaxID=488730 RepID=UPI003BEF1165
MSAPRVGDVLRGSHVKLDATNVGSCVSASGRPPREDVVSMISDARVRSRILFRRKVQLLDPREQHVQAQRRTRRHEQIALHRFTSVTRACKSSGVVT